MKKYLDGVSTPHLVAVFLIVLAGAGYAYSVQYHKRVAAEAELTSVRASSEAKIQELTTEIADLTAQLQGEVHRNNAYGDQVETLAYTVGQLEKLSKTDRELLQKYSNVYFLSENFIPSPLADIDPQFVARKDSPVQIHGHIKLRLEHMMQRAASEGAPLLVLSGYRSFGTQAGLKASYSVTYGKGTANQFSADQGYSEHQLGSAVDFTSPDDPLSLAAFEASPGFAWLLKHAHEYGFILSYPKGNKFFTYEPWHWRYVGIDLATRLHVEGKSFYDLDQREINTYLVRIFD